MMEGKVVHEKKSNYSTCSYSGASDTYLCYNYSGMVRDGRYAYKCANFPSLIAGSQYVISQTKQ